MSDIPHLEVAIRHRLGALALDVAFTAAGPWTVLFAPSGAGKSTIFRAIAGLLRPQSGRIAWRSAAEDLILTGTQRDIFVPPHRRRIPYVAQQAALFPHMTVRENIAYAATGPIDGLLDLCRIAHLANKMPATLSGGERQRTALARALAPAGTRLLLLDEPFTGLDTPLRDELLAALKPWLAARNIPVLHVTHDVGEIFALEAHVIRLHEGRITAQGSVPDVLRDERQTLLACLDPYP